MYVYIYTYTYTYVYIYIYIYIIIMMITIILIINGIIINIVVIRALSSHRLESTGRLGLCALSDLCSHRDCLDAAHGSLDI